MNERSGMTSESVLCAYCARYILIHIGCITVTFDIRLCAVDFSKVCWLGPAQCAICYRCYISRIYMGTQRARTAASGRASAAAGPGLWPMLPLLYLPPIPYPQPHHIPDPHPMPCTYP